MPVVLPRLSQALALRKAAMNVGFERNQRKKDDPDFKYDVRKEFEVRFLDTRYPAMRKLTRANQSQGRRVQRWRREIEG